MQENLAITLLQNKWYFTFLEMSLLGTMSHLVLDQPNNSSLSPDEYSYTLCKTFLYFTHIFSFIPYISITQSENIKWDR